MAFSTMSGMPSDTSLKRRSSGKFAKSSIARFIFCPGRFISFVKLSRGIRNALASRGVTTIPSKDSARVRSLSTEYRSSGTFGVRGAQKTAVGNTFGDYILKSVARLI